MGGGCASPCTDAQRAAAFDRAASHREREAQPKKAGAEAASLDQAVATLLAQGYTEQAQKIKDDVARRKAEALRAQLVSKRAKAQLSKTHALEVQERDALRALFPAERRQAVLQRP